MVRSAVINVRFVKAYLNDKRHGQLLTQAPPQNKNTKKKSRKSSYDLW
jgi:hypothetical protein